MEKNIKNLRNLNLKVSEEIGKFVMNYDVVSGEKTNPLINSQAGQIPLNLNSNEEESITGELLGARGARRGSERNVRGLFLSAPQPSQLLEDVLSPASQLEEGPQMEEGRIPRPPPGGALDRMELELPGNERPLGTWGRRLRSLVLRILGRYGAAKVD